MDIKRDLTEQEEEIIYRAINEFQKYGRTDIGCPICSRRINYVGNNSSFSILREKCGNIYSLRGI